VLLTVRPQDEARLRALAGGAPVRLATIGTVGGTDLVARVGDREARLALDEARAAHEGGLPEALA
jgi:hypothetical protein